MALVTVATRVLACAALGVTIAAAGRVRAQSATESPTITVRGAPAPRSASEQVVEARVLRAAPHREGSELLSTVPGVFISQHGGEGEAHQIFFRGFDAVHGQDIEVWAGGAPVNDVSNIHGQGYADLHFLIPEVVEEIRSTPGAYDPAQGDFAVAGSLHFGLGYREPGVTARASLGSFGSRRYFLAYHPEGSSSENFGAAEIHKTDGFGPSRSARRASGMAQVMHDFGSGVTGRVLATAYATRFDSAGVLRLDDIQSGRQQRTATYDPKQGGFSSRAQLVLELARAEAAHEGRQASWSVQPYVVSRALELRSNFTGFLTSPEGDSSQQRNDALTLGAVASYRRSLRLLSNHDSLAAGVSLRSDAIEQSQRRLSSKNERVTDDEQNPGIAAKVRATDAAGYVDATLHPLRRVTLRGGARIDGLSYLTEDGGGKSAGQTRSAIGAQLSKRGTLAVVLAPGLTALTSYGEGFRSPQARSLGDGEPTPFTRVVSYEAGLRYRQAGGFQSSIAAFRTQLSDDLLFDQATARNELVPGTTRTGVAANLVAEPTDWFVSSTSFTYTRAVFSESDATRQRGDLLPYVPQIVVRCDLAVTPKLGTLWSRELRAHAGLGLTYLGRRPLPYSEMGHDALVTDATVALRLGPVETSVDIFNVLDADWYEGEFVYASAFSGAASLVPTRHVTVAPPRTLFWTLSLFI